MAACACVGTATAATSPHTDVRAIAWTGRARVDADGRSLDLIVDTRIEPFGRVRARSWTAAEGAATARTLILESGGQWILRGGTRMPLPAAIGAHERAQYALYGYLLLVQQASHPPGPIRLHRPPSPPIDFILGYDGFPTAADYRVAAAEPGGATIEQHITFLGRITANGVRWPRRIAITRTGMPYFTLDIDRLSVEPG